MNKRTLFAGVVLLYTGLLSCSKNQQSFSGAYKDAVLSPVKFLATQPVPGSGIAGVQVKFKLVGADYLKGLPANELQFFLNGVEAPIDELSPADSSILVTVPENASSGAATLVVGDRIFFGPQFRVNGDVWFDSTFNRQGTDQQGNAIMGSGVNGAITDIHYEEFGATKNIYIMGLFTSFNGEPAYTATANGATASSNVRYMLKLDPVTGLIKGDFTKGEGPNGALTGLLPLTRFPGFLIYGGFSRYNERDGVNNMTRIYEDGKLDSIVQNVYNPNPLETQYNVDTLPAFIGGFNGGVLRAFIDKKQRIISVGNFRYHNKNLYNQSTYFNVVRELTYLKDIGATDQDGNLDTTYNYDRTRGQLYKGANAPINDAVQVRDGNSPYGKIIVVGKFTAFNGIPVPRIMRLDDNGQPDPGFQASANGEITRITYNSTTRRLMVVGSFTQFNGVATPNGVIMLHEDGATDMGFQTREMTRATSAAGQLITYAAQMNDGKVIVSGSFEKYKSSNNVFVTRQGFMILDETGELVPGMNNTGAFSGEITDMLETLSGSKKALILVGRFGLFDNMEVGNMVRIGLEPK